jgi:LuxR family transcriptional regulator
MKKDAIELELSSIRRLAPAGFSIGIAIRFFSPIATYIEYPEEWVKEYTQNAYVMVDPAIIWGLTHEGVIQWRDIKLPDTMGIIKKAKKHDLIHGLTCSIKINNKKTLGSFARADRAFTETEAELIKESLERLHIAHMPSEELTMDEVVTLEFTANGLTGQQIAEELGIAIQTVKSRLSTARRKLGAKNTNEASALAKSLGLFEE